MGTSVPEVIEKGDWIDLQTSKDIELSAPKVVKKTIELDFQLVDLGIAMKLPAGYEAVVVPRSSTYKKYGLLQTNSAGIIDNSYSGSTDWWKMPVIALSKQKIPKGTRLCQFRIQLSQRATIRQKIKWLFTSGIEFEQVHSLDKFDRKGFGSTGD